MTATALGRPRVHHRATDSTNARARDLAAASAPHGTLVTAGEQTAGRGRQGRRWSAPASRALLGSLVVRRPPRLLPLAAGVAVADTVSREAALKWPNDVLVGGRKVAGILVEARLLEGWAVLGIGVNVALREEDFPGELRGIAGTLGRSPEEVEPVLERLLVELECWLGADEPEVLAAVRERDALLGQAVRWADGEGVAAGIDDDGCLVVKTARGEVALAAGEVHLQR